jgi:hypothetical protein
MSGIDVEVAPNPRGLQWFITKALGSLAETRSQDKGLEHSKLH